MRATLLDACKIDKELACIDIDFQHLFRSWFNRGFLVLREIDWHSPASILEKIIAYEAVHAINSWSALRARLEPADRRCFAFFHPAMLDEPLIFVQVALAASSPTTIRQVLEPDRPRVAERDATTAVFYSISNCQRGLAGVSFGNFLIKQVARELSRQLPDLQTFRTLSPVPGFMRWVKREMDSIDLVVSGENGSVVESSNTTIMDSRKRSRDTEVAPSKRDDQQYNSLRRRLTIAERIAGSDPVALEEEERVELRQLVAHYLCNEKRSDYQPIDPVARFHLGNGASLDTVLPEADVFAKGLEQSAGVMVSYLYDLDKVEDNHEAFANQQSVVHSAEVQRLLDTFQRESSRA